MMKDYVFILFVLFNFNYEISKYFIDYFHYINDFCLHLIGIIDGKEWFREN